MKKKKHIYPRLEYEIGNRTARELCKELGLNYTSFLSARTGYQQMYPNYRKKLSKYFGVPENELFTRGDEA